MPVKHVHIKNYVVQQKIQNKYFWKFILSSLQYCEILRMLAMVLLFIFKTFNKLTFCAVENTGFSRQFASSHALPRAHRNDSLQCAIMCKYPWQRMWCSLNSFNEVPGTFWLKQQMRPWIPNIFRQLWNQLKGTEWCHHIIILSNAIQPIPNRFYFHPHMCQSEWLT